MFTCCLHCKTCFRVTAAQLKVAQGKVRCGKCHQVFNAKLSLHEQDPTAPANNVEKQTPVKPAKTEISSLAQTPASGSILASAPEPVTASVPTYQREDHEHFSLSSSEASGSGIDAIFDALDEQLSSGIFEDILPREDTPPPAEPDDIDVNKLLDEQLASLQGKSQSETNTHTNTSKADDIVLDLYSPEDDIDDEYIHAENIQDKTPYETLDASSPESPAKNSIINTDTYADVETDNAATPEPAEKVDSYDATPEVDETDEESNDSNDSSFFDKLREKTTAESQQLELGIGDLNIVHDDRKKGKTSSPNELKQAIDSIIQINTGPEEALTDDSIAGAEHVSIKVPKIDLGTERVKEKNSSIPDVSAPSLDDAINDAFGFEEDADDVSLKSKIDAAANLETGLVSMTDSSEFKLQPIAEATSAVADRDTQVTDDTDIWPDSQMSTSTLPIGAHYSSSDASEENEIDEAENQDEWDAVLDVSKINIPDPEAVDTDLPGANNEDIVLESDSFELPDNNAHAVPLALRNSLDSFHENEISMQQRIFKGVAIFVLLVALVLQVFIFKSSDIVQSWPGLRNNIASICASLPCRYTGKHDLKKITMLSRDIRVHPKNKGALLITAAMANKAVFAQPYPDILIRFTDLTGEVIAQRRFNPQEYLGNIYQPFILMPAKTPVHLTFAVLDPGSDAINFEFDFL